jgi:hypothetical protein
MCEVEPGFQAVLNVIHVQTRSLTSLLSLREVPLCLATYLKKEMEVYDSDKDLAQWLTVHAGMVIQRTPIHWGKRPEEISEEDYASLHVHAKDITSLARAFCPYWYI